MSTSPFSRLLVTTANTDAVTFTVPAIASEGYVGLIIGRTNGEVYAHLDVYLASDCVNGRACSQARRPRSHALFGSETYLSNSSFCVACPPNTVCPGGVRRWPMPGSWALSDQVRASSQYASAQRVVFDRAG